MKKWYGIFIALLMAIFVINVPETSYAMKQSDLGGKVFLVDMSNDENFEEDAGAQNERILYMFNKNGTRYIKNFVSTDGQGNITGFPHFGKENKKQYNKAIKSKKGYYAIDMDMSVKDNDYRVKGNKIKIDDTWGTIQENGPDDFVITWPRGNVRAMAQDALDGNDTSSPNTQHFVLANQQYKFKW